MKRFVATLPRHLILCCSGRRIIWHGLAIIITIILVISSLDWQYFRHTRSPELRAWMFPAVHIGGLLPIVLPLTLFVLGACLKIRIHCRSQHEEAQISLRFKTDQSLLTSAPTISKHALTELPASGRIRLTAWAICQAEIIGGIIAAGYKALTGRAHPARGISEDLTHVFHFGFLRGGVFWGWPSSHTTIAFAMAFAVFTLDSDRRWIGYLAVAYAFYVGIGVSMTIHWFSDFVAGAIIGTVVGTVVGKGFRLGPSGATAAFTPHLKIRPERFDPN